MLVKNLLYILQQENYELRPYLRFVYTHYNWWHFEQRGKLTFTSKVKLLYLLSCFLGIGFAVSLFVIFGTVGLALIILLIPALPLIIALALIALIPVDRLLKLQRLKKAKAILRQNPHLKVIGITGSYGKTSTREILTAFLSTKYRVLTSPDNINTDLGIAQLILTHQAKLASYDIFIVEMGAYHVGEIKTICNLVEPDYSILTGINESHLERFGSLDNTISAKFELPVATKKISVLNVANQNIKNNFEKFNIIQPVLTDPSQVSELTFLPNFQGFSFNFEQTTFTTSLLAAHNIELILPCLAIAKELEVSPSDCAIALKKLKAVPHRLEPIRNAKADLWIIDDSYNGNFDGIKSGLQVLKRASGRKIVLTPGLVELGDRAETIHKQIGELYALLPTDLVLLVQNKYTTFIVSGLTKHQFSNYKIYPSTQSAHADLGNILKAGDTIIFQNDWPDNYF